MIKDYSHLQPRSKQPTANKAEKHTRLQSKDCIFNRIGCTLNFPVKTSFEASY